MTLDERLRERGFSLEPLIEDGEQRLSLRDLQDDQLSPLTVDFTSPALIYRLKNGLSKNQPLAKALGIKSLDPENAPRVIDATAGLGTDALVIAALGCKVRSIERSEAVFALLQDGRARLEAKAGSDEVLAAIASRLSFEQADARDVLKSLSDLAAAEGATLGMMPNAIVGNLKPDVVYLDPMYPEEGKSKSALPKKTMQMFRRLLDGDEDADQLLDAALKAALRRVVVKRPLRAPPLTAPSFRGKAPAHSFEGKTARYDLYLV